MSESPDTCALCGAPLTWRRAQLRAHLAEHHPRILAVIDRKPSRGRRASEQRTLDTIRDAPAPITHAEIADHLDDYAPATITTALSRLIHERSIRRVQRDDGTSAYEPRHHDDQDDP